MSHSAPELTLRPKIQAIQIWLLTLCALILAMVAVGGITRLTGSGLSITEWKPIMGAIPPMNEKDWDHAFQLYQQSPQFRLQNQGMSLDQFKFIFFWEYFHRLLGRLIGMAFFIPWIFFLIRGQVRGKLASKLGIAFLIGGLQGLMGWIMVKSGLVDRPSVSHFRLAAHLSLAFGLMSYLLWIYFGIRQPAKTLLSDSQPQKNSKESQSLRRHLWTLTGFLCLQIIYGAFVAGLKAGFAYNTYPKMNDVWIPDNFFILAPKWLNFLENGSTIQFVHRWLGAWVLTLVLTYFFRVSRSIAPHSETKTASAFLLGTICLQFLFGIGTLVFYVPLPLAVIHQLGAAISLGLVLWNHHSLKSY